MLAWALVTVGECGSRLNAARKGDEEKESGNRQSHGARPIRQQRTCTNGATPQYTLHCKVCEWMRSKRIGIIVIALLALATSAVIVLKRFRSATAAPPPAAVRETQAVGSVFRYEIVGEYPQDRIAIIQPDSGQVTGWIDLAGLKSRMPPLPEKPLRAALNGIAYDAEKERLLVTGKLWPKVFEIRLR